MNPLWNYLWPMLMMGLVVGGVTGTIAFRREAKRIVIALSAGLLVSLGLAAAWHGPLGASDRFSAHVERTARTALDYYEMPKIEAHLHRSPVTRRLVLSGPADDFQTSELARLLSQLPGVSRAQWSEAPAGRPLILEGAAAAILGFLVGSLLAYLFELRRRYNAQWNW
jgi:hypothetical protein